MDRAAKRSAVCTTDSSRLLGEVGLVKKMLSYIGPGHWHYIAAVSKLWQQLYTRVPDTRKMIVRLPDVSWEALQVELKGQPPFCTPQMTLYSSVFGSASIVRLAHADGLDCNTQHTKAQESPASKPTTDTAVTSKAIITTASSKTVGDTTTAATGAAAISGTDSLLTAGTDKVTLALQDTSMQASFYCRCVACCVLQFATYALLLCV
jgi:hypothetical protein